MATTRNIQMQYFNGTDYDTLYPYTTNELVGSLPITGGTMTGPLILNRNPIENMEAVTKAYLEETYNTSPELVYNFSGIGQAGSTSYSSAINMAEISGTMFLAEIKLNEANLQPASSLNSSVYVGFEQYNNGVTNFPLIEQTNRTNPVTFNNLILYVLLYKTINNNTQGLLNLTPMIAYNYTFGANNMRFGDDKISSDGYYFTFDTFYLCINLRAVNSGSLNVDFNLYKILTV